MLVCEKNPPYTLFKKQSDEPSSRHSIPDYCHLAHVSTDKDHATIFIGADVSAIKNMILLEICNTCQNKDDIYRQFFF